MRKPKTRRSKSNNTPLILTIVALFGCGFLGLAGLGGAFAMGMFDEPPLPTIAPTKKVAAITAQPTIIKAPTAANQPTTAAGAPTVAPTKTAITETVIKLNGQQIEGLAIGQERNGTVHIAYGVLSDAHPIVAYQKPNGGAWTGGNSIGERNAFTPLLANNPANGQLCFFWTGTGLFKRCFVSNAWTSAEKIDNDVFASSPSFAPDGATLYLTSASNTVYKGVKLDLPNTTTLEKYLLADSTGRLHVITRQQNTKEDIIHRVSEDKGATWSEPFVIASKDFATAVAADTQGRLHLLLKNTSRVWSKDKGWSAPSPLKVDSELGATTLAIDSKGVAHALIGLNYLRQNADGAWTTPTPISKEANILISSSNVPQMFVATDGTRHFAWALADGTIRYATLP